MTFYCPTCGRELTERVPSHKTTNGGPVGEVILPCPLHGGLRIEVV